MGAYDLCEPLEWDSSFFGFKIARVTVDRLTCSAMEHILGWCDANRISCLYFLSAADDAGTIRLAEDNHFRLVDVRLTYERSLTELPASEGEGFSGTVRVSIPEDIPVLKAIARTAHHDTRFYFDPNFPAPLCDALYATWIEKSCNGYADAVFVAEVDGQPAAYISCQRLNEDDGQIGLLGVSPQAQAKGIGQRLVTEAVSWFASQELKRVSVVTQARNWKAQRLYQRCGFLTRSVQLWYHRWFVLEKLGGDEPVPNTI